MDAALVDLRYSRERVERKREEREQRKRVDKEGSFGLGYVSSVELAVATPSTNLFFFSVL